MPKISKKEKFDFYDVRHLLEDYPEAYYYMVIGERSNGKTYSSLYYCLERYVKYGEQFAYVRRFGLDIKRSQMNELFSAHVHNKEISILTDGEWTGVDYSAGKFYFIRVVNNEIERSEVPFGFAFDLNSMEHYKSISFPNVTTVVFDEFLSRQGYLNNEFILFTNTLSTIIRHRNDVKIFMLGNTVNKYCPYFAEMGLVHIKDQKQGTIDVYTYGESSLTVVVEYCESTAKKGGKKSDVYFAFDNPQLQMITNGSWEIAIYPHLPVKYKPKDVALHFFIEFDKETLHCEIVSVDNYAPFIFVHRKTTPIKRESDIVYGQSASIVPTQMACLTKQRDKLSMFIQRAITENRIFYSENDIGEIFRNYLIWSDSYNIKQV